MASRAASLAPTWLTGTGRMSFYKHAVQLAVLAGDNETFGSIADRHPRSEVRQRGMEPSLDLVQQCPIQTRITRKGLVAPRGLAQQRGRPCRCPLARPL